MTIENILLTTLAVLFAGLCWFLKDMKQTNDRNHLIHFTHATSTALHETERERASERLSAHHHIEEVGKALIRHMDNDEAKFDKMDSKIDGIGKDINDILKMLNEKESRGK